MGLGTKGLAAQRFAHVFFGGAPSPRYDIPPYLIAKDLRAASYLGHTSSIPYAYLSYLAERGGRIAESAALNRDMVWSRKAAAEWLMFTR